MAEWKKYEDIEEQVLLEADHGVIFNSGYVLICERNPHHDKIIEWARTGRPVELEVFTGRWVPCRRPVWNVEDNYRFAEPKAE